jgi:endonuclease G
MQNMQKLTLNSRFNLFFKPASLWVLPVFLWVLFAFQLQSHSGALEEACPQPLTGEEVIRHAGYTFSYNEAHEQANWVAYCLTAAHAAGALERADQFRQDPSVTSGTATDADYAKSGYDRGHLAPAADMRWSELVMSESFYYSNMSPQVPGFNRGVWKRLETQVRDWALQLDSLLICTGPILHAGLPQIGANHVSVPEAYFKAVLSLKTKKGIAFVIPNASSKADLMTFAISIDQLEALLHRDFFYQLPIHTQEISESKLQVWP